MAVVIYEVLDKLLDVKKAYLWKLSQKYKLTPLQMQILASIKKSSRSTPFSAHEIAKELYLSRATVSVALKALERKGLVAKVFSAEDRRKQFLTLKSRAEGILGEMRNFEKIIERYITNIPEKEVTLLSVMLIDLLGMLHDAGIVDRVAMCMKCTKCLNISRHSFKCDLTGRQFSRGEIKISCRNFTTREDGKHARKYR